MVFKIITEDLFCPYFKMTKLPKRLKICLHPKIYEEYGFSFECDRGFCPIVYSKSLLDLRPQSSIEGDEETYSSTADWGEDLNRLENIE